MTIRHLPPPFYSYIPYTSITYRYNLYTPRETCFFCLYACGDFFFFYEFLGSVRTNFGFLSGGRSRSGHFVPEPRIRVRTFLLTAKTKLITYIQGSWQCSQHEIRPNGLESFESRVPVLTVHAFLCWLELRYPTFRLDIFLCHPFVIHVAFHTAVFPNPSDHNSAK